MKLKMIAIVEYRYFYENKESNFKGRFYTDYDNIKNKNKNELLDFVKTAAEKQDLSMNVKYIVDVYNLDKSLIII